LRSEGGVHGPGRRSAASEHELEYGDVPAERADTQETASQPRPSVPAERCTGPRAEDPVDDEAAPALKGPHGLLRLGPEQAVDRACVEAMRTEADLERADPGIILSSR
jgi:hypothetical protein